MKIICAHCGKETDKKAAYVNRALAIGAPQFCDKKCAGLNRRTTKADKVEIKRLYDIEYRKKNAAKVKERAIIYNQSEAGRAMQKRNREKFKENHRQYIKSEKYRIGYKKEYDKKFHAKANYGEFWEAAIVLNDLEVTIEPERFEAKCQNGLINKSQKRKRLWNSMPRI